MLLLVMMMSNFGINLMMKVCGNDLRKAIAAVSICFLQFPGFFSGGAAKKNGPSRKEVYM